VNDEVRARKPSKAPDIQLLPLAIECGHYFAEIQLSLSERGVARP